MDKSTATAAHPSAATAAAGPKVSQIANLFQRKPVELAQDVQTRSGDRPTADSATAATHSPTATVVRTESHAARFNNARALFEKLGEGRVNRPPPFSIKMSHSSSREDNLSDIGSGPDRSPSPKRKQLQQQPPPPTAISNGIGKLDSNRILNQSRLKSEKPEKPEKPERKFNSRELIEKQKNWTSHFSKTRTTKGSDFNRCDIIRTVPGTGIIAGAGANAAAATAATAALPVNSAPTTNGNYSAIPNGSAKEPLVVLTQLLTARQQTPQLLRDGPSSGGLRSSFRIGTPTDTLVALQLLVVAVRCAVQRHVEPSFRFQVGPSSAAGCKAKHKPNTVVITPP